MRFELLFAVIGVAVVICSCRSSKSTPHEQSAASATVVTAPVSAVTASSNTVSSGAAWLPWPAPDAAELRSGQREASFAMAVSQQLAGAKPDHIGGGSFVFAPVTLAAILALSYEGSRGATRAEIAQVLGLSGESGPDEALGVARLATVSTPDPLLRTAHATAIWTAPGVVPLPAFRERAKSQYQVEFLPGRPAEPPTSAINGWLKDAQGAPNQLQLAVDSVRADVRLAMVDFLSVEGAWRTPFAPERTRPLPFTGSDGRKRTLPTMTSVSTLLLASGPEFDAVELSLTSLEHHLFIVAPKLAELADFQRTMDTRLSVIRGALHPTYVELQLPRYALQSSLSLRDALTATGIVTAFSENADFGAMVEGRVYLDQVLQNVAFEVNERGLRAASVTVASYPPPSAAKTPVLVRINRPFLFGLINIRTGAILFWGSYAGPEHGQ